MQWHGRGGNRLYSKCAISGRNPWRLWEPLHQAQSSIAAWNALQGFSIKALTALLCASLPFAVHNNAVSAVIEKPCKAHQAQSSIAAWNAFQGLSIKHVHGWLW